MKRTTLALASAVFLVALVPRLSGIGTFFTADEKNWLGRGVEFLAALRDFRFNDTLQTTHPGIPTLWLAGVTAALTSEIADRDYSFDDLRTFLPPAQVVFAVSNAALLATFFVVARGVVGTTAAFLAGVVVALDPLLVGHGKIVHVDSLLAGFSAVALLLLIAATRARSEGLLVAAGIMSGLAILEKLPGLVLVPVALAAPFVFRPQTAVPTTGDNLRWFGRYFAVTAATVLLLWPGLLWVPDPIGNLLTVKRDLVTAASVPHHMSEDYSLDPARYPATMLTRTTVPTLFGFVAFLLLFRRGGGTKYPRNELDNRSGVFLLFFMAVFLAFMLVGAKKGGRYLLPLFPVLDLLAVIGVLRTVAFLRPHWEPTRVTLVAALLLLAPLSLSLVRLGPYALAHYNPLFPANLGEELGWGEGLDQVARFLNAQDDGDRVPVASWYPSELRPFVRRPVFHLNAHEQLPVGYVVLYRNMFGRPPDHPANDFLDQYYRQANPVFTAIVNGLPYAWVYRKPAYVGTSGERLPPLPLVALVPHPAGELNAIEILVATYSGRATRGSLTVTVYDASGERVEREVTRLVSELADDEWARFSFRPISSPSLGSKRVRITATDTVRGNAPTLRVAPEWNEPPRFLTTNAPVSLPNLFSRAFRGSLAVRFVSVR